MNFEYNGYTLEVKINEDYLVGRFLQFPGEFSIVALTVSELRQKFKRRVDTEIQKVEHKGYDLTIRKSLNSDSWFHGTSEIKGGWSHDSTCPKQIIQEFKNDVENLIAEEKKRKTEVFVNCCVPIIEEIANDYPDKMNLFHQLVIDFRDSLLEKEEKLGEDKHTIPDSTYLFFCNDSKE